MKNNYDEYNHNTILYHNTPYKNLKNILRYGIKVSKSVSEKPSGYSMIWATNHPVYKDAYGGTIIKFQLPKNVRYEKVNNDQYIIYDNIPADCIIDDDILIGNENTGFMHQSEVDDFAKEFGKNTVKRELLKNHSEQLTDDEVRELTPELEWNENENLTEELYDDVSEEDVLSAIEEMENRDGMDYIDTVPNGDVILLTKGGDYINVANGGYDTHSDFLDVVSDQFLEGEVPYHDLYEYCIERLGWVTLNTGFGPGDDRFKVVAFDRPNTKQCNAIEDWLDDISDKEIKASKPVTVYAGCDQSNYNMAYNTSRDIVKKICNAFSSGVLESKGNTTNESKAKNIELSKEMFVPFSIGGNDYPDDYEYCDECFSYGVLLDGKHIGDMFVCDNEIVGLMIDKEHRKKGIGKEVVRKLIEIHPNINTVHAIPQAHRFWSKCGFVDNIHQSEDSGEISMSLKESSENEEMSNEYDNEGNQLTKAQAEFFKNSKVRDEQGRLLVCYHKSQELFTTFDISKFGQTDEGDLGLGFYFGLNSSVVNSYRGSYIYRCYIDGSNPYIIQNSKNYADYYKLLTNKLTKEDVINRLSTNLNRQEYYKIFKDRPNNTDAQNEVLTSMEAHSLTPHEKQSIMRELGYDCVIDLAYGQICVFNPNQIKSMDNENPTNSDNINESIDSVCDDIFVCDTLSEVSKLFGVLRTKELRVIFNEDNNKYYVGDSTIYCHGDICWKLLGDGLIDFNTYLEMSSLQNKSYSFLLATSNDLDDYHDYDGYTDVEKFGDFYIITRGDFDTAILKESIKESLLLEKTKQQLIDKSKNADNYSPKNQSKGKNRYERRLHSSVANSVAQYNKIDMDAFFKRDILTIGIEVHGETDNYIVTLRFKDVLQAIQNEVKHNKNKLEFKCVYRALSDTFASKDVKVDCSCPDFKYRIRYFDWKNDDGTLYEPRPSNITNPHDSKGAGCKHILLVLSNRNWIMKVASVIVNYIKYCQKNLENNYATYMFPKIYGLPYKQAVQMSMFPDSGMLPSDAKTLGGIASTNMGGRDNTGKFTSGNQFRFQKKYLPNSDEQDDSQMSMKIEKGRNGKDEITYQVDRDRNNLGRFAKGNQVSRKNNSSTTKFGNQVNKQLVPNKDEEET